MTRKEIAQMIAGIGLPYAYDHFEESESPGNPPFICYTYSGSAHFIADGVVYQKIDDLEIELYTDEKDFDLEEAVEDALDSKELVYSRDESHIDSEKMYMVTWTTSIILTKEEKPNEEQGQVQP